MRGLGVLAVSVTLGVVSLRLVVLAVSVTLGVVSLRLVVLRGIRHAQRGLFAARCSRGIRHARRGLFAACWSWGSNGRSAGHGDVEVGLWREIIDCVERESPY